MKLMFDHAPVDLSEDIKNRMLEEAVKRGSAATVKLLLSKFEPDPEVCNKLLFEATEANHDSVRKVELILDCLPEASQLNKAGQTLLHVGAGGKPPRLDVLELALNKGVDPNIQDRKKDTALHKVTKNYAERKKPWWDSRKAMELLLKQDSIDLNKENAKGKTPLHNLVISQNQYSNA
jgi:hypothetical protein